RLGRHLQDVTDVVDVVGGLIPDASGRHPAIVRILEHANTAKVAVRVVIADHDDFRVIIAVHINDERHFIGGAAGVGKLVYDSAGGTVVDAQIIFVRIHHFRSAIAIEVEDRRTGDVG